VPATELVFAITISGEAPDHQMLTEILQSVLGHIGVAVGDIDRLLQALQGQAWAGSPGGGCDLRFERQGGELQMVVSQQGREWRMACAIGG
jgi:hypothetical protein